MEKKGLRVNAGKTKVMICGTGLNLLQSSGEYPCADCRTDVGNNSIYCNGCNERNVAGYDNWHQIMMIGVKGGCAGSSESIPVKMPHCWKSHLMAQMGKSQQTTTKA